MRTLAIFSLACGLVAAMEHGAKDLSPADMQQIRTEYERNRHSIRETRGAHSARNPGQQWLTEFDGRGFTVRPDGAQWSWGLDLVSAGFAGSTQTFGGRARATVDRDRLSYQWPNGVSEWYVNGVSGLEHGFTIKERPRGNSGNFLVTLAVRGGLQLHVPQTGDSAVFTTAAGAAAVTYSKLVAWDATGARLPSKMMGRDGRLELSVDASQAQFPVTIDPIAQHAYVKASNTGAGDQFASSIAISGNTVVIGAPFEDSNGTGVNSNTQSNNGATDSGAAYVYVRNSGVWTQQAYLKASNTTAGAGFGWSVGIDGDTIIVGAPYEGGNGSVYIFTRSGTTWTQQTTFKPAVIDSADTFGWAVAISGNTVAITSPFEDSNGTGVNSNTASSNAALESGAAYVFVRTGSAWSQEAYLKASNTEANDQFGRAVAISVDTVVVGTPYEDSNGRGVNATGANNGATDSGAAYVFVRNGTVWTQQAYLKSSNSDAQDNFAIAVAIDGDTLISGAPTESSAGSGVNPNAQNDNTVSGAGAAYVFVRSGTTWTQQAYLKPSNTPAPGQSGDNFGYSVGLAGNNAIVGSPLEDSNGTGVNSNTQTNEGSINSGAAYVFQRTGSTWAQAGYLKASNTGSVDLFGARTAISLDTAVAGASLEDSAATGINGNGANDSAAESGAAYIFILNSSTITPSGSGQTTQLSTPFSQPLIATVRDTNGNLAAGVTVNFTVPGSGASATLSAPSAITNASGVASVNATANGVAGTYTVNATVASDGVTASYVLTNIQSNGAPNAPVLVSPTEGQVINGTIINFQWNAVAGATSYEFRLKEATNPQIFRVSLVAGSTNAIYTFPSGSYRWEMEACNANGCSGTSVVNFVIQANPIPNSPPTNVGCVVVNDTNQNRLNCNWTGVAGADFHFINVVQQGTGPGGGALTVAGGQVGGTSISILIPNGAADVLIRGCNGDGCGPFAPSIPINPAFGNPVVPILGEPFGGSLVNTGNSAPLMTFSWNRVAGDNGSNFTYRLYVQDFSRNRPALDVLTTSNFYGAYVNPGTRYDALVIAIPNGGGQQRQGPASPFLVRGAVPNAPIGSEPTYGSTVARDGQGRVHVAWTPMINADGTASTRLYQYFFTGPTQISGTTTAISLDLVFQPGGYLGIARGCNNGTSCNPNNDIGWGPWNNANGSQGAQWQFTVQ